MPRPYNPNTKYGRKKARQEFQNRYNNEMTPEERSENDFGAAILFIIIMAIVLGIVYAFSGTEGVIKYLRK